MGVAVGPGAIPFTTIPNLISLCAIPSVIPFTARLLISYGVHDGLTLEAELTLSICPWIPFAIIWLATAWLIKYRDFTLALITASNVCSVTAPNGSFPCIPAEFTKMSIFSFSENCSIADSIAETSFISKVINDAPPIFSAAIFNFSLFLPII